MGMTLTSVLIEPRKDEFGNIIPESNLKILTGFWAIFCLLPAIARFLYGITLLFFNVHGEFKENMLKELEIKRRERVQNLENGTEASAEE